MKIEDTLSDNQLDMLFKLAIVANVLQIGNFMMDSEQISNDAIMKELRIQDKVYLEKILENQKLILERLDKLEKK